mmetsp:Transcript_37821/g.62344  ORF Transcript_37821/g.62344 Transcript_37821/m.62344 type:complete len:83 (-) Transcript_37821:23-271(-)
MASAHQMQQIRYDNMLVETRRLEPGLQQAEMRQADHAPSNPDKLSTISSIQHAGLGVPNSPFQGLSKYTPHTPTFDTLSGHK